MRVKTVVNLLQKEKIVILETETTIGLFSLAKQPLGVKINKLKDREEQQPLQVMVANFKQLEDVVKLSAFQESILKNELPGRKSFLLSSKKKFSRNLVGKKSTVLIRMPSQLDAPKLSKVLEIIGPLFATSANKSNELPLETLKEAKTILDTPGFSEGIKQNGSSQIISLLKDEVNIKDR